MHGIKIVANGGEWMEGIEKTELKHCWLIIMLFKKLNIINLAEKSACKNFQSLTKGETNRRYWSQSPAHKITQEETDGR